MWAGENNQPLPKYLLYVRMRSTHVLVWTIEEMVLNCEDAFEVLRGVPIFCWVLVSVVLLSADVRPAGAVHEFKAYRMQHFDLHGIHYGMSKGYPPVTSKMTIMCMHTRIALCMDTSVHMHTHVHVSAPVYRYEHTSLLVHIICARTPVYSHTDYYVYTHTPLIVHT